MKIKTITSLLTLLLLFTPQLRAGQYYALCEGNFGQANASLWSFDEALSVVNGPIVWDTGVNPLGDVGQSMAQYNHKLYIVMNNSHTIRILDLETTESHVGDIDLPGSSPRFMAIQESQQRGFISSWGLGGLLIMDLANDTIMDTLFVDGLPEEIIIKGDRLFTSLAMHADWTANNQVLEYDISGSLPMLTQSYTVIDGPGSMAISSDKLYVTSVYYNDIWESFSGTSSIDLMDGSVLAVDHGSYSNYSADIDISDGVPYRIFGNFIVPLNDDLTFNPAGSIGNTPGIYSFSVQNDMLVVGTSDFVAPDDVLIYAVDGSRQGTITVGGLPGEVHFYDSSTVGVSEYNTAPLDFSLSNNYPNPFNPNTTIPFHIHSAGHTSLTIYDVQGRSVQSLTNTELSAGKYELSWDGKTFSGATASSGIYFAILAQGQSSSTIKLNLIK